jgi:hypothetical protein
VQTNSPIDPARLRCGMLINQSPSHIWASCSEIRLSRQQFVIVEILRHSRRNTLSACFHNDFIRPGSLYLAMGTAAVATQHTVVLGVSEAPATLGGGCGAVSQEPQAAAKFVRLSLKISNSFNRGLIPFLRLTVPIQLLCMQLSLTRWLLCG